MTRIKNAFTLVELLVVISIIGILIALSMYGLNNARQTGRDAQRKSDLEQIRSALEFYKSDCGEYPASLDLANGANITCGTNTYLSPTPTEVVSGRNYVYRYIDATDTYVICASLETATTADTACSGLSCGTGYTCSYHVANP